MVILASKSPRRTELMNLAGFEFDVIPAVGEELLPEGISPSDAVVALAEQKAMEVAKEHPHDIIIGADTVVALGKKIMGKPVDETDAYNMLKSLSGREHSVFTGVCIICEGACDSFYKETKVEFYDLSDNQINEYISTGEPIDKAGAYGIQEKGALLVSRIDGDFYNVVGLPIAEVSRRLTAILEGGSH